MLNKHDIIDYKNLENMVETSVEHFVLRTSLHPTTVLMVDRRMSPKIQRPHPCNTSTPNHKAPITAIVLKTISYGLNETL